MRRKSRLGQTDRQEDLPFMRTYYRLRKGDANLPSYSADVKWKMYQAEFAKYGEYSAYGMKQREDLINKSYYIGSVLSAKRDPLGRFILMDLRAAIEEGYRPYFKYTILSLSGAKEPTIFGSVYIDRSETDDSRGGDYIRQHGGPGARVKYTGLGVALYTGSALITGMAESATGTYSPRNGPKHNRTNDADKLWDELVKNGLAETENAGSGPGESSQEYCMRVRGRDITGVDYNGNEVDGTITTEEICGEVDYEFDASSSEDFIDSDTILDKTPLFVWPTTGDEGRRPFLMESTYEFNRERGAYSRIAPLTVPPPDLDLLTNYYGTTDTTADEYVFPRVGGTTAEMLAAAYHGGSVDLIFDIATVLRRSASEDLMIGYLRRLDIANTMQAHPERMAQYLELLGQQRLPGVGKVSLAGINEIRSVHKAVRLGQLKVDPNSDNPLNIPKLSAKAQRVVDKLPED